MEVKLSVTGLDEALKQIENMPKQVRFAASVGLNRTMNEAQKAIQDGVSSRFTVRRPAFIKGTVYRKPGVDWASHSNLVAGVRINPDRPILAKFEAGGTKEPTGGRKFLAVPVDVRRTKSDLVSKANSVKALLASGKAFVKQGKVFQLVGRAKQKTLRLAYVFKKSTPLPNSLHFVETGTRVINERAVANIEGAIVQELARGLSTSNGPTS